MAKAFSVAIWNIEHFGQGFNQARVERAINYLLQQDADIYGLFEISSGKVYQTIMRLMPEYTFYVTEGEQTQEILIAVRTGITVFLTQKTTFKSGQTTLRPGVLVTPCVDGEYYPLLFLHLKSLPDPKGFGLRSDMLKRAFDFRNILNDANPNAGPANYMFLGDLNTMGLDFSFNRKLITGNSELNTLDKMATRRQMIRLRKSHELTWWNGSANYAPGSNLDHVVAAEHLTFNEINGSAVSVRGWITESIIANQQKWIADYSDHCLLYFEVDKV